MISFLKKYRIFFIVMGIISAIGVTSFYYVLKPQKRLPVFSPADVNPELVDEEISYIEKGHKIADFSLTNQNGKTITQKDYEGKIYVADFFFTTCPTICPKMTDNMVKIQEAIKDLPQVKLLSHSVTPEIDSVPVLKKYALEKGIDDSRWNLVTGDKKQIFDLARRSYLAVKIGKPEERYDMVHTENFVLVDAQSRVRGFYDGTNDESVAQLIEDLRWLATEGK